MSISYSLKAGWKTSLKTEVARRTLEETGENRAGIEQRGAGNEWSTSADHEML